MQKSLTVKILVVGALVLVLMIPILMIRGVIADRTFYRAEAYQSVSSSWTGPQNLSGPILVIPYIANEVTWVKEAGDSESREIEKEVRRRLHVLPESLNIHASVETETRVRGLYSVPVYHARLRLEGQFE